MPITIGSNIASLKARRQLDKSSQSLSATYERLASGQRINRASDDAAGLAIATSLESKTRLYSQALRNVNDGISMISIASGALGSMKEIVTRIKELATQASNGTLGASQRKAIDKEADSLTDEYNRIISTTSFNGLSVFGSDGKSLNLHVGTSGSDFLQLGLRGGTVINAGNGSFTHQLTMATSLSQGPNAMSPQVADFNGDGLKDVLIFDDSGTSGYSVLLNSASGTFSEASSGVLGHFVGARDDSIVTGDFNNDGKIDFVAIGTDGASGRLSLMLGNGDGTFRVGISNQLAPVGYVAEIKVGDLNNDGNLDFAFSDYGSSGFIGIGIGQGNGTFAAIQTSASPGAGIAGSIDLVDMNNDGILDIVDYQVTNQYFNLRFGRGDGTFEAARSIGSGVSWSGNTKIAGFSDVDGDGDIDVGISDVGNGVLYTYFNSGSGTFATRVSTSFSMGGFQSIYLEDINGDEIGDFVAIGSNAGSGTTHVLLGRSDGTFASAISSIAGAPAPLSNAKLVDLDRDGALDIVGVLANANSLIVGKGTASHNGVEARVSRISRFDLTSRDGALDAMVALDKVFTRIQAVASGLGGSESRLSAVQSVVSVLREQYSTAQSRIQDADIAQESSQLIRQQILQQSAASVLAQANIQPQVALRLLGKE